GAEHHTPRLRHLLEACRQVGGVPDGGVVHAQVIADLAHHDGAGVDANPHLQAEPALGPERLGHITDGALDTPRGGYSPAWAIFVSNGGTEQRHDPIAGVLIDRPFKLVDLGRNALEAAVDDLVHDLRIELLSEGGKASHVSKQDRDLLTFAFESAARGE